VDVTLPWGAPIRVRTDDAIGRVVLTLGVLDLPVSETLLRLADPGEVAADVGANIGCMTAALARAVGRDGVVWAFEPHPGLFEELRSNVSRWGDVATIKLERVALSSTTGQIAFETPDGFEANRGLGRVATEEAPAGLLVEATTLDSLFADARPPEVVKIDVEGHELAVLQGGAALFSSRRVRDCVFEEHGTYPTPATRFLEERGYRILDIGRSLLRVVLRSPGPDRSRWEARSFLATLDPGRAEARLGARGWRALGMTVQR
jgi:FkbM family methyltransferase